MMNIGIRQVTKQLMLALFVFGLGTTPGNSFAMTCSELFSPVAPVRITESAKQRLTQGIRNTKDLLLGRSPLVSEIQDLIRKRFYLDEDAKQVGAFSFPDNPFFRIPYRFKAILKRLPALTPHEREELIDAILKTPTEGIGATQFKETILLGLYHRPTWIHLIPKILEPFPQEAQGLSQLVLLFAEHVPDSLREEVLTLLGTHYSQLQKNGAGSVLGPKRIVDYYFKLLLKGDTIINDEIAKGHTPTQAFATYVAKVDHYIHEKDSYNPEEILGLLRLMQKTLIEEKHNPKALLYVGGSLPNGRAKKSESDLDVVWYGGYSPDAFKVFDDRATAFVEQLSPGTKFHVSFMGDKWTLWSKLHPVVFRISTSSIELLVFRPEPLGHYIGDPTGSTHRGLFQDPDYMIYTLN